MGAHMIYCDLAINGTPIWYGKPCLNLVELNFYPYTGLYGSLQFMDLQGSSDPFWSGLGDRFQLAWIPMASPSIYPSGTGYFIPLNAVPSQQVDVSLLLQYCTISIYDSEPS